MRRVMIGLVIVACGASWAASAAANDPYYRDRHFRHFALRDGLLAQDFHRREIYRGWPDEWLPSVADPYGAPAPPALLPPARYPRYATPGFVYHPSQGELRLAKQLIPVNREAAKRRLRGIIERYPGMPAAIEAERLLRELR